MTRTVTAEIVFRLSRRINVLEANNSPTRSPPSQAPGRCLPFVSVCVRIIPERLPAGGIQMQIGKLQPLIRVFQLLIDDLQPPNDVFQLQIDKLQPPIGGFQLLPPPVSPQFSIFIPQSAIFSPESTFFSQREAVYPCRRRRQDSFFGERVVRLLRGYTASR